jgi:hypothetical protein
MGIAPADAIALAGVAVSLGMRYAETRDSCAPFCPSGTACAGSDSSNDACAPCPPAGFGNGDGRPDWNSARSHAARVTGTRYARRRTWSPWPDALQRGVVGTLMGAVAVGLEPLEAFPPVSGHAPITLYSLLVSTYRISSCGREFLPTAYHQHSLLG